jgi:hypothetical protein
MSKFKYNDLVRVISDPENDGFFVGLVGLVKERRSSKKDGIQYGIEIREEKSNWCFWAKGEEIEYGDLPRGGASGGGRSPRMLGFT